MRKDQVELQAELDRKVGIFDQFWAANIKRDNLPGSSTE